MAHVFNSHSSRDNEPAGRIKVWLGEQGFEAPFLDFDKHAGIPPEVENVLLSSSRDGPTTLRNQQPHADAKTANVPCIGKLLSRRLSQRFAQSPFGARFRIGDRAAVGRDAA